jgi:hypothetical protein
MKFQQITIILISVLIILISIDLTTGIFYWNRLNLAFSAENFNNILTPIVAIISLFVYALALIINFRQSQIIQSQHIKPYFTDEIHKQRLNFENITFETNLIKTNYENCNGLNYPSVIMEQIKALLKSHDFLSDLESFEKGIKYNQENFKQRDYYKILMFISQFTFDLKLSFKYKELIQLGKEINESKLLESDKVQLRRTVNKEILIEYISFIEFDKNMKNIIPKIPELYSTKVMKGGLVDFKRVSETSFSEHYTELKETFKNSTSV